MPQIETEGKTEASPRTDGESRREQKAEAEKRREEARRQEAKARREAEKKPEVREPQRIEIPFKDARKIAEVVTAIQDEKQVIVSPNELASFKKILTRHGNFEAKAVEKMTDAQIVVVAQQVLKNARIAEPQNSDFEYEEGSENQKVEEKLAREQIAKAQSTEEETLTEEKVEQYLQVEEFAEAAKTGGPGTMEAEGLPDEASVADEIKPYIRELKDIRRIRSAELRLEELRDLNKELRKAIASGEIDEGAPGVNDVRNALLAEMDSLIGGPAVSIVDVETKRVIDKLVELAKGGITTGSDWETQKNALKQKIDYVGTLATASEPSSFKEAYLITKAAEAGLRDPEKVLPEEIKTLIKELTDKREGHLAKLDDKFREKYSQYKADDQQALVGEIDREAITYFKQIVGGLGRGVDEAKASLMRMIREDPTGLKEWRVMRSIEGLDAAVRINQLFEVPVIPEEIPQHMSKILGFIEGTDLSVEELQATIQQAINLVRHIAPDTSEGREQRDVLVKELEAFRAFHSLRITLERTDMDPSNLLETFRSYFDDETWVHFVTRFGRDERFREFIDKDGKPVNLLDASFELYSEQLRLDRIRMDIVEELTKHAIENEFGNTTLREIQRGVGFRDENGKISDFAPMSEADFNAEVQRLRQYFKDKMQAKINDPKDRDYKALKGRSVDDVWGRKARVVADGREIEFLGTTRDLIQDWYTKNTLQGAFGFCHEDDLVELAKEFGMPFASKPDGSPKEDTDEEKSQWKAIRDRFLGTSFLKIRREYLREQLMSKLRDKVGLKVKMGEGEPPGEVSLEDLREMGFLESVDNNAYHLAWVIEWSNYDSIRIYSRDTKSKLRDDYDHLVFNQATNVFFGRQIDQTWEFYHQENENRGRPKENDINRIWKQFLPGKHSWLFPQNNLMVRWADFFMTEDQKKEVDRRTRALMAEWDFDNQTHHKDFASWMRMVAVRDMLESGEISFGKGAVKFSEVANLVKLRKFEFIDVFIDRSSHKKFVDPAIFQDYLANPTEGKFIDINDKVKAFYSTRDARQWPWMTLAWRAHWEIANKHRQRLFNIANLSAASGEMVVDGLIGSGNMERKQGEKEKRKWFGFNELKIGGSWGIPELGKIPLGEFFGTTPLRRARQSMEIARRTGYESPLVLLMAFLAGFWAGTVEFIKQLPRQVAGGR